MKIKIYFLLFIFLQCIFGCMQKQFVLKGTLDIPQSNKQILKQENDVSFSKEKQEIFIKKYKKFFFIPWTESYKIDSFSQLKIDLETCFVKYFKDLGYGSNKILHTEFWLKNLYEDCDLKNYPNFLNKAIVIRNTNLRILPTDEPRFLSAEDYPFDRLQVSTVYANTPIFITHASKNKAWFFVKTSFASGWIKSVDIAFVDDKAILDFMKMDLGSLVKDNLAVYDLHGNFVETLPIGANIFVDKDGKLFVATTDFHKYGKKLQVYFPEQSAVKIGFLEISTNNAVNIADEFLQQQYGWGGLFGYRDCSSTVRDYFSVFGIWLPRNSQEQIRYKEYFKDLSKMDDKQKKEYILKYGIPYWTILWMKGHIMLYVGQKDGEPLILHNIWGLRVKNRFQKEYTNIIGKTVITTLEPAIEISGLKNSVIKRIAGIRNILSENIGKDEIA